MTEFEKQSPYPDQPNPARIYNYYLGGSHNFDIDLSYFLAGVAHKP